MANLGEVREFIEATMDYAPASDDFKDKVHRIINTQYFNIFTAKAYNFAQKECKVKVYKDHAFATGGAISSTQLTAPSGEVWPAWCEGQEVYCDDGTNTFVLEITYRLSDTVVYYKLPAPQVTTGGGYVFTTRNRYVDLPHDCVEVLNVSRRTDEIVTNRVGKYIALSRYEDEWHNLPLGETGIPQYWVNYDNHHLPSPVNVYAVANSTTSGQGIRTVEIAVQYIYRGANDDDWDESGYLVGKRYSGISKSTSITLTDSENIRITTSYGGTPQQGLYWAILWKAPDNGFKNWRIAAEVGTSLTNTDFDITLEELGRNKVIQLYPRSPENNGNTKRMRLYPRQSEDIELHVRYVFKPPSLAEDEDNLQIPSSAATYAIGYGALENLAIMTDNDSRAVYYQKKKEQALDELDSHFLTSMSRRYVKDMMPTRGRQAIIYTTLSTT
jgi:hypothetical protein|tara:strand:- start:9807 stop:11132 length:1326 start_codon:yes stop_codon:yes gene_type:complete